VDALLKDTTIRVVTVDALLQVVSRTAVVSLDSMLAIAGSVSTLLDTMLQARWHTYVRIDGIIGELGGPYLTSRALLIQATNRLIQLVPSSRTVKIGSF